MAGPRLTSKDAWKHVKVDIEIPSPVKQSDIDAIADAFVELYSVLCKHVHEPAGLDVVPLDPAILTPMNMGLMELVCAEVHLKCKRI